LSGGLSINPIAVLPFQGMDFGFGPYFGVGINIGIVELGGYWTTIIGKNIFISKAGWFSLLLSRRF
jgi:hypothetical protein